jgi:hypothetical protein
VRQDVLRLDRLIGDIGEAARTDAELARARFEPVDLGDLVGQICSGWEERRLTGNVRIAFARPRAGLRDRAGRARPPGPRDRQSHRQCDQLLAARRAGRGGGGAPSATRSASASTTKDPAFRRASREAIFNRFVSVRPESDDFGRHSGLGLAIARAIVKGHDGEIDVADRDDAPSGARFTICLPAADPARRCRHEPSPVERNAARQHRRGRRPGGADHRHLGLGQVGPCAALIDRGFTLVSDDQTIVQKRGERLHASAPPTIRGKLEIRGLGIVDMPSGRGRAVAWWSSCQRHPAPSRRQPRAMICGVPCR